MGEEGLWSGKGKEGQCILNFLTCEMGSRRALLLVLGNTWVWPSPVLGMRQWKVWGGPESQESPEVVVGGFHRSRGGALGARGGDSRIWGGAWNFKRLDGGRDLRWGE